MSESEDEEARPKATKRSKKKKQASGSENGDEEGVKKVRRKRRIQVDVAEHPSYKDMVVEAIQDIGENASFNDIHKHLTTFYTLKNSPKFIRITLASTIKKLIEAGKIEFTVEPKRTYTKSHVYGSFRVNENAVNEKLPREAPSREMPKRAAHNRPTRPAQPISLVAKRPSRNLEAPPSDDSEIDADYRPGHSIR
uniref:H15 domain-containing protein n=1 Tax=Acrobeloides nanus TaxID=290746 RepID=A0A914DZJ4_9BILA